MAYLVTCIEAVTSEKASIDVKECERSDNEETQTTVPGVHRFNLDAKLFVKRLFQLKTSATNQNRRRRLLNKP